MNELSNTIDLESTLIKAEALFARYKRLVEAIDKKQNFPKPRKDLNDAESSEAPPLKASEQTTTTQSKRNSSGGNKGKDKAKDTEPPKEKIITPELRALLKREVEVLPRHTVAKNGDGMPSR